jgi:dihydrofolate reductase
MKVSIVAVVSVNGLITSDILGGPEIWASPEDLGQFNAMIGASDVVIMGRKTFDTIQDGMHHRPKLLRIVMTKSPDTLSHMRAEGILEFTDKKPTDILSDLRERGLKSILIAGGSSIHSLFLQENLVTDLYLTVEPYIFGNGIPFLQAYSDTTKLSLMNIERLNDQGSLLLHYQFLKNT